MTPGFQTPWHVGTGERAPRPPYATVTKAR